MNLLNKKGTTVEITASIASDKYSKGCTAAPLTITINKVDQYVEWDGNEIINGFDTQRSTEDGIVLNAIAKYTTKATGANIKYNVVEQSNCNGEGNLIRLEENNNVKPRQTTLYYTGNGSGTVTIEAIAEATDEYNATKPNTQESPKYTFTITRVDCNVDDFTVAGMRYGDKVVLEPTVDKFTRGKNYEYTLPTVTGTLDTAGNVLYVKGVGDGLTISAKKLEDCWVTESADKVSNTFNIAKSEQKIEWDKTVLGTPQEGAYHFGVLDGNAYQLATQAIDKLHKDAAATWLPLDGDKYVTANVSGDAAGELSLVYSVVEQDGVQTIRLDITNSIAVRDIIAEKHIDVVVNCAAYTNVEGAEDNTTLAEQLNATAPKILAEAVKDVNGLLIQISTDYVFGKEPYNVPCREHQKGTPTGVYGATKLHGEQNIFSSGCKHIIIRTAWLYSEFGKNFCKTMLSLLSTKQELKVVFDQTGTPTYALDLANAIAVVIDDYGKECW